MALRTVISLISTGSLTTAMLADDAVTADKVADGAIDASAKIASGVVTAADIDLTGNFNFTGALQAGGATVSTGSGLYYAVVARATTGNVSNLATGAPQSVDGSNVSNGDDVLVWQQSTASANGIYDVTSAGSGSNGQWARAGDRDAAAELPVGLLIYVKAGSIHGEKTFRLSAFAGTLGTDAITIEEVEEGLAPSISSGGEPEVMGTGNGSNLNFDFDAASPVYVAVFVDGMIQAPSTFSVSATGGSGGVGQLQFGSGNAPANGALVEAVALYRS